MNNSAPGTRTFRRLVAATVAIVAIALASQFGPTPTATTDGTAVVAIIHPMQPIGNIDCCH
jgi:hypothetical protein